MGLFRSKKKSDIVKENNDFDNGYIRWYANHNQEMKGWEKVMVDAAVAGKSGNVDDRLSNLKKAIDTYYAFREFCYSKNEYYKKYFNEMWEQINSSDNKIYIKRHEEKYQELLQKRDELYELEQRKAQNTIGLDKNVLDTIKNNEGILQKDLYKHFDSSVKSEIAELLYFWAKDGVINREKVGNTYKLSVK